MTKSLPRPALPVTPGAPALQQVEIRPETTELADLVRGLCEERQWAVRALLEDFTPHVRRVLVRILGQTSELDDLVQEVFVRALARVHHVVEPQGFRAWLAKIAVFVARENLRTHRRRLWWMRSAQDEKVRTVAEYVPSEPELEPLLIAFYSVVRRLEPDEQVVLTLRHVEGMKLEDLAAAMEVSLATVKRRLSVAEREFSRLAEKHPLLCEWSRYSP
jgi:RNA polymerase sigma-70 factor (ECF subfamily)